MSKLFALPRRIFITVFATIAAALATLALTAGAASAATGDDAPASDYPGHVFEANVNGTIVTGVATQNAFGVTLNGGASGFAAIGATTDRFGQPIVAADVSNGRGVLGAVVTVENGQFVTRIGADRLGG